MSLHDLIRLCIVTSYSEPTEESIRAQLIRGGVGALSMTDLRIATEEVRHEAPLNSVYAHAVGLCRPVVEACSFAGGEALIAPQGLRLLNQLLRWISLDLLVVLACVEQLHALDRCPTWKLFPRFGSLHLRNMLAAGVGDMHMHEMALRQPEDLWRRLVMQEVRWERVSFRKSLFDPWPALATQDRFRVDLSICLNMAAKRHTSLDLDRRAAECVKGFRDAERQHVFDLLKKLRRGEGSRDERRYLSTKNTLWRLVRQPDFGSPPGLEAFAARWYPAVPKSDRDHHSRQGRHRRRPPRAYLFRELGVPLQILAETAGLARVELRSSPMKQVVDYAKWTSIHGEILPQRLDWSENQHSASVQGLEASGQSARGVRPIAMRLAVHFRRSAPRSASERLRALRGFDREAAALLKFRCRFAEQACRIARLDMAVAEREMGCRNVGFAYRMLRGAVGEFHEQFAAEYAPRLFGLSPELQAEHRSLPRLGATCHAGEDFCCQLSGLREVADAIYALKLRDGDSIGHGLALGWDPRVFFRYFGETARLRVGEHFDALLWAFVEIDSDSLGARWRLDIESRLFELLYLIYPDYRDPVAVDFWPQLRLAQLRFPFVPERVNEGIVKLVAREYTDQKVFLRRNAVVSERYHRRYSQLLEVIEWLRQKLIAEVSRRGIVIEVHPSSNMRVGGSLDPAEMPTVALLENEKLVCAIGTDDPGVFATNIEYEYALMEEALIRKNDWSRQQAVTLLDRARRASLEAIYWPGYQAPRW